MAKINITLKDLKVPGVVVHTISPFNSPVWTLQKPSGSRKMTVNYCKLNQDVIPIAVAVSDVVFLLNQITYPHVHTQPLS